MTRSSVAILDIVYWPLIQLMVSAAIVRLPPRFFRRDTVLTRPISFELSMRWYRILFVHRWKKHLPDGAPWVGGRAKRVAPFDPTDLQLYLSDNRSSETAHWIQLVCASFCWLWNPLWACIVMTAYAVLSNFPCILAQRYNRALIHRRTTRSYNYNYDEKEKA